MPGLPEYDFAVVADVDGVPQIFGGELGADGELDPLTEFGGWSPVFLSGGTTLHFLSDRDGQVDVYRRETRSGLQTRLSDSAAEEWLLGEHGVAAFATDSAVVVPTLNRTEVVWETQCERRVESLDSILCDEPCVKEFLAYVCEHDDGAYELSVTLFPGFGDETESTVSLGRVGAGVQWISAREDSASETSATGVLALLDSGIVLVSYPGGEITRLTDDPSDRELSQGFNGELFFVRGSGADAAVYRYDHHVDGAIERAVPGDGPISGGLRAVVQADGPTVRVLDERGDVEVFEQSGLVFREPAAAFHRPNYSPD